MKIIKQRRNSILKRIYYYVDEVGMERFFSDPLTEEELIINGYRYTRNEVVNEYPWEEQTHDY